MDKPLLPNRLTLIAIVRKDRNVGPPGLYFARTWAWIAVSIAAVAAYGVFLGPTIRR
jgi:hypothetical protein